MLKTTWDDVSGKELSAKGVREAGGKEMTCIWNKKVWVKMDRQEAVRRGCEIIGNRWVNIDKGDSNRPDYRSRLVAKEINTGHEEGLYASTPPLEALT